MNTRLSTRMARHVDPKPGEEIVQPAEHVDFTSLERGIDAPVVDLVDEINDTTKEYNMLRDDAQSLHDIAVSLEEYSLLALEGIGEETGLEAQTLMAIQYGANQHLRRVGAQLEFKSLEDNDMSNLNKTVLSVESLGDALGKIWDGIANVAKRAAQSVLAFLGHMKSFVNKMKEKATTLKSQLMALEVDATGDIKSSAAKRLFYGDKTYRQLNDIIAGFFSTSEKYLDGYAKTAIPESRDLVKKLTSFGTDGIPKINPEEVAEYIIAEEKRRGQLLDIGYGGRPRSSELHDTEASLRVDYSKGLPGGYRFVSTQPILTGSSTAVGDALLVMREASFDLEADKSGTAPAELPVLSRQAAIQQCDAIIDFCGKYDAARDASMDAGQYWWDVEADGDKFEKAMEQIQVLSGSEINKLKETPDVAEAFSRGASAGIRFLTGASVITALHAFGYSGSVALAVVVMGSTYIAWVIPAVLVGGVFGVLLKGMMTKEGLPSSLYFKSTDPNAPLLALMRGIATCRSWMGMYTVDTFYAIGEYYTKLAPAMLEYVADSAKAHLAAQKEAEKATPAQA